MSMLAVERRRLEDRRSRPTKAISRFVFGGSRGEQRRYNDTPDSYVDVFPESWLLGIAVATVLLSILDGYLTLIHLQNGGKELNPLVDILIEMGWTPFIIIKSMLSATCVIFLVVHKNFFMVKKVLVFVFFIYLALLFYHLYLRTL